MAHTQIESRASSISTFPSVGEWRELQAASAGNYNELASRPWSELRRIEIFPNCRLDAPVLEIPARWMAAGTLQRASARLFDPAKSGLPSDPAVAAIRDESIRRALYALWLPRLTSRGIRAPKPSTWRARAGVLLRLAKWQFENLPSNDGSVFNHIKLNDILTGLYLACNATRVMRSDFEIVISSLIEAGERGVISDWPRLFRHSDKATDMSQEPARKGMPSITRTGREAEQHYQPFSDAFVTEFGRRAIWIQENLADQAIEFWKQDMLVKRGYLRAGLTVSNPRVIKDRTQRLHSFPWTDAAGQPLRALRYPIKQFEEGTETLSAVWPPSSIMAFKRIIGTIQGCNFGIVNLCTGARSSEILAADDTPLGQSEGRYESVTFKMVDELSGKPRDWPLHPIAVRALRIQHALADSIRPPNETHLWVVLKAESGTRLTSATTTFARAVDHLGLEGLLGSSNAHMHRWRHTVARLVALSVVGAPQVLLDLFGHRDLTMVLTYMLSAPDIVEEALNVAKETTYALAETAISETIRGEAGGSAAAGLQIRLQSAMRQGEEWLDTKSLREATEILTFSGKFWSLVRPGVICTKGLNEFGPCATRGQPDPGNCRTYCDHRLETSIAKRQCEDTLLELIDARRSALEQEQEMLVAHLDGQISAELRRWPEVSQRTLTACPEISHLWSDSLK